MHCCALKQKDVFGKFITGSQPFPTVPVYSRLSTRFMGINQSIQKIKYQMFSELNSCNRVTVSKQQYMKVENSPGLCVQMMSRSHSKRGFVSGYQTIEF